MKIESKYIVVLKFFQFFFDVECTMGQVIYLQNLRTVHRSNDFIVVVNDNKSLQIVKQKQNAIVRRYASRNIKFMYRSWNVNYTREYILASLIYYSLIIYLVRNSNFGHHKLNDERLI